MRVILSFAICLAAGSLSLAQDSDCGVKFLLTAPKILLAGTTEKICVDLLNSSAVELGLTLETDNYFWGPGDAPEPEVLAEVIYSMDSERECFDLEVPSVSEERQRSKLILEVTDMSNPERTCNRSKNIMVSNAHLQTLIQTDKPIYKPGQPVKFRMMSVDKEFKPCNATVALIYIETPNGIRLAQWEDIEPNRGLVDLEFPMTSEPLLGDWTIKADFGDRRAETTFRVEEYVLPKFEITVESTPSYFLLTDTSATVKICARYTYGQPVQGTMAIEATITSYRNNRPTSYYEGETDSDGCYSLDLDLTMFELRSQSYSTWNAYLKIDADITDSVTGESLSHSAEVGKVSQDALSIAISTSSTFKPGVPFYGTIHVNHPDQTPAGDEFIILKVQAKETGSYRYKPIFTQNYTSPADGVIDFTIPDINFNTTDLSINAEAPGFKDLDTANYTQYRIYNPFGSAYVRAQYSPSGSFVQIEPIYGTLAPGSTQNLNIFLTSDTADAEETKFEFVFMSLGDFIDVPVSAPLSRRRRQAWNGDEEQNGTECEGDLVFNSCSTACPLICFQNVSEFCTFQCIIGCVCPEGLFRDTINGTSCMTSDNCTKEIVEEEEGELDIIEIYPPIYPIYPPIYLPDPDPVDIAEPGQLYSVQRSFEVTADMSPGASLLVYYIREDGEVVADSITFSVEETFANEVTLGFADSQVKPNGETTLDVTADPDSLCGVGVVDKSVYVLGGDNVLTKDALFDSVRAYQLDRYGGFFDSSSKCSGSSSPYRYRRRKRTSVPWYGGSSSNFVDSSTAFKNIGLVYLTSLDVETKPCPTYKPYPIAYNRQNGLPGREGPVAIPFVVEDRVDDNVVLEGESVEKAGSGAQIRSYFPETFLWDLVTTDDSGSASIDIQAPHTITDWIANAFCLSPENGLGVAPATSLTTFQPFFLSFSLPYSVIRGENVPIKISVFNYLDACLVVRVTLSKTENFTLLSESDSQDVCVCGGQADSVEFRIVPLALGQIPLQVNGVSVLDSDTLCGNEIISDQTGAEDTVRRDLLVKAEGVPEDFSWSSYFCLADHPFGIYHDRATLPPSLWSNVNLVPDSTKGKIIITDDMLGPSLENLEHLIRLPTGCGEQNMLGFVPNIVALEYLSATNQLTDKLEEKIKGNMRVGYQRELNYRHSDGSFSAFGESDESGNTWLTAFVVRSLVQSSDLIYVDRADLNISIAWLKSLQNPDTGCIRSVGYLGYKAMMGGVSGESMLTAYVVVTFLEAGLPREDEGVVRGLECVIADLESVDDTYALAQIAYALALADRTSEFDQVMNKLKGRAVTEGDLSYWNSNRPVSPGRSYGSVSSSSINIEINSYMVLTQFLRLPEAEARQNTAVTIRWLIKNRGAQGGFGSTQDTVMGLTALAKFAANSAENTVLYVEAKPVSATGEFITRRFYLNENTRRLQIEHHFDGMLRVVNFRGKGEGCALIQIAINYNVKPSEPSQPSFTLKTAVDPLRSKKGVCNDYRLTTSTSYNDGLDEESNMALVTVVPPSGFYPIKSSLESLKDRSPAVKRFEIDGEKINFYFDTLDNEVQVFSFDVTKEFNVEDVKPGYVTVTDYYEKSLTKSIELELECDPDREPIDVEFLSIDPVEEDVLKELIPPPPPPPFDPMTFDQMTLSPSVDEATEERVLGEGPEPQETPITEEGTPFPGFGFQPTGKEGDQNVSKPVEAVEDKLSPGPDKLGPESKDGGDLQGAGEEDTTKEGGVSEEADEHKPGKATDGTPAELKTDITFDERKEEGGHSSSEEVLGTEEVATMATDQGMVTEIVYVEGTEGTPEDVTGDGTVAYRFEVGTPLVYYGVEEIVEGTEVVSTVLDGTVETEVTEIMTGEAETGEAETGTAVTEEDVTVTAMVEGTEAPSTPPPPPDFDECTVANICPAGTECFNFPGTYECRCLPGYTEDEEGNCHDCAYCGDTLPEDGKDRFCSSDFVYIVKRRKNDLRLLKEKRFTDEVLDGRVYRSFEVPDNTCTCDMLGYKAVERFIIMANATSEGDKPLILDHTATILPFMGLTINELDGWRDECP
eukprot:XP_011669162.1 PREDICTED: alpha-2-macroglobulin isoform X2 [Strongylocentrotus purpuratus]